MDDIESRVIENREIIPGYFVLRARPSKPLGRITPGQFCMVKVPDQDVFFRRPFSIYDYRRGVLSIMYKVVGKGTESLSRAVKHEKVLILAPLGKGFRIPARSPCVVVAGGIGIAGVAALVRRLGKRATVFFGCSNRQEAALAGHVLARLNPGISTLDGTCGFKGHVVGLLAEKLGSVKEKGVEIFACGPENMIRSLKDLIEPGRIPCQVLLEERMACGLGLCFGCVKKTIDEKEPYKRVCKEGPVFDLWEICL
jgi:dihydroorotate dehydrogenase electron transfer subunit